MKEIKHQKWCNTGLIYELLFKQITHDVLNNTPVSYAIGITKRFFSAGTAINEEWKLYNILTTHRTTSENHANAMIDEVLKARLKISENVLVKERHNLINEISKRFGKEFFDTKISNYKVLASIYKLFEAETNKKEKYSPNSIIQSRYSIIESISCPIQKSVTVEHTDMKDTLEIYRKQDKGIKKLTYKILESKFLEQYVSLSASQKNLLKNYIIGLSKPTHLKEYMQQVVPNILLVIERLESHLPSGVIKIKAPELRKRLNTIIEARVIKDEHVQAVMLAYELIREIKQVLKRQNPSLAVGRISIAKLLK